MKTYEILKPLLMSYAKEGVPFLSFDQFNNIVQLYRDEFYACQHIEGFIWDIGKRYNFWTVDTVSRYHRHVFFAQIVKPIRISFEIPSASKNSIIPLSISMFDDDGPYFTQEQNLAVELNRFVEYEDPKFEANPWKIYPWRKIDTVCAHVLENCKVA